MAALIIGGTGSLGKELTRILTESNKDIHLLSRDELKQAHMKRLYPEPKFFIGDVRDKDSLRSAFKYVDEVYYTAALKHVDIGENNPEEVIKTNIIGAINVADLCEEYGVRRCLFTSSDKAVDPINIYGYSKAAAEKVFFNRNAEHRRFYVHRWGNILASRGSAIQYFVKSIKEEGCAYVTHQDMTRFWLTINVAADFLIQEKEILAHNHVFFPTNSKGMKIVDVIECIGWILGKKPQIKIIGLRPGEKMHERLVSMHEGHIPDSSRAPQYTQDEMIKLLTPIVKDLV